MNNKLYLRDFILGYFVMAYFSFFSTLYLYLPLIVKNLNISNNYIGILGTFYSFGSVLSGFVISPFVDKYKNYTLSAIKFALILKSFLVLSLVFIDNFYYYVLVLFLVGLMGAFYIGTCFSLSFNRGITTSISSGGFLVGYFVGSILGNYKLMFALIFILYIVAFMVLYFYSNTLKENIKDTIYNINQLNNDKKEFIESNNRDSNSVRVFLGNLNIYLPLIFRHSGAAMIWLYFTYILLNYYHLDLKLIGILNAINIIVQTFSNPFIAIWAYKINRRISTFILVFVGYFLSSLYFLFFPFVREFLLLFLLQFILGISFSSLYLGNIENLILNNKERVTALSLLSSTMSLSNLIGSLMGTILYALGYKFMFLMAFLLCFLALVFYTIGNHKDFLYSLNKKYGENLE